MKILVIVESPGKIKKIQGILQSFKDGHRYTVMASFGHVMDLDPKRMSIDVKDQFKPAYTIMKGKHKVVRDIREMTRTHDEVLLAADDDREGEAIAYSIETIIDEMNKQTKGPQASPQPCPYKRIIFHSITPSAIKSALANPTTTNYAMVDAQKARRCLDRIVGYELSPLVCRRFNDKLSAGRVQSVVLKMVVEKEKAILSKSQRNSTFKIKGTFGCEINGKPLAAPLYCTSSKKLTNGVGAFKGTMWNRQEQAEATTMLQSFQQSFQQHTHVIHDVADKNVNRAPPSPYITSSLQQDANGKLKFGVKKTMDVAQKLYEAGHITYMRTDSTVLCHEAQQDILALIARQWGDEFIGPQQSTKATKAT